MNTTVEAHKNLYVARGGELTDSYEDIAGGAQVGNYTVIPDCVSALSKVGGSSETYETVAEIQVGEMEGQEGRYSYEVGIETVPEISESETYYLNDENNPSTLLKHASDASMVGFNLKIDDGVPTRIDPSKPFVVVGFTDDVNDSLVVQSDTLDLSNTTVKILKKVSAPSGGGKFIVPITMSQQGISSDVTLDQIKSAFDDKQSVVAQYSVGTDTAEIPLIDIGETHVLFSGFISTGENVEIRYQTVGGWSYKRTQIKPTYEFGFTVTPGSEQGTFVATPDTGVTYAGIVAALAETPNVYAVLTLGFNNQIIRALFSVDSTASGAESTSALALFYDGTKFQAARLMVSANGADIVIKDT